jgi:putative ABC transport system permease protein
MLRELDVLRLRLRSLFKRSNVDNDLDRELRDHLEHLIEENMARGMSPKDARYAALRAFGNVDVTKEESRDTRRVRPIENLMRDLRHSLRSLLREPMLLIAATISIALGAGGNIAVFSLARELLFTTPHARHPEELVKMQVSHGSHVSYQHWRDLDESGALLRIAGISFERQLNWFNGDAAISVTPMMVTANFFDVIGVPLALGRTFTEREARAELDPRLAVITHSFWQQSLGSDSAIVGKTLLFDGEAYTVTGVLVPGLRSVAGFALSPGVYLSINRSNMPVILEPQYHAVSLIGRLKPNQTLEQGRAAVDAVDRRLGRLAGDSLYAGVQEFSRIAGIGGGKMSGAVSLFIAALGLVALLVLLIACANVAGLLIARGTARRRETAIRLAIGGTRRRLLQQFLVEGFWLALIGTAGGLLLSVALMRAANSIRVPIPIPIQLNLTTDVPVLACAVGLVILTTLLCALLPALGATRRSVTAALKVEEPRYVHRKITPRVLLLGTQVTFSTLLLVTSLLFVRNLARTKFTSPGFDVDRTLVAQIGFAQRQSATDNLSLLERTIQRLSAIPGVQSAAASNAIPLTTASGSHNGRGAILGAGVQEQHIEYVENRVGPGYFSSMGIRVVQGREFASSDRTGAPAVVIVNEEFARQYFPGESPVGSRIRMPGEKEGDLDAEVVGVASNIKHLTLGEEQRAAIYFPLEQRSGALSLAFVILRTSADPASLIKPVRQAIGELDRSVAVEVEPMSASLEFALLPSRIGAVMLGSLGALGLILAAFGLYAIVAYNVSRRIKEIAIRGALGATRARILRLVVRDVAAVVGIGVVIGLGVAAIATKPLAVFLVAGLRATDPLSFAATALVFGLVSVVAGWLPARGATRVSPSIAMRAE